VTLHFHLISPVLRLPFYAKFGELKASSRGAGAEVFQLGIHNFGAFGEICWIIKWQVKFRIKMRELGNGYGKSKSVKGSLLPFTLGEWQEIMHHLGRFLQHHRT